jgi:hypothetical protein
MLGISILHLADVDFSECSYEYSMSFLGRLMKLMALYGVLLVTALVTACGGGGGSIGDSGGNSSKAASSVTPSSNCSNVGDVFIDAVCSPWRDVSVYEQSYSNGSDNYQNTNGREGRSLRFGVIQSNDEGRNKVLDVEYLANPEYYGAVQIRVAESVPEGADMSEYANGKIQFELKVISYGIKDANLDFTLDCTWPCASTPKVIKGDALNVWQSYEFSVADLIDWGLDIQHVSQVFMLLPPWGEQAGVHYQVDNIRWVKGDLPLVQESICYANFFDQPWISLGSVVCQA